MKHVLALTGLLLLPAGAWADVVALRGGGELRGVIVERRADAVVIETGPGRVTIPMSVVTRITGGGNELAEYRARAARISPGDAAAWVALGQWAREHGLYTQARDSFEHALAVDRDNEGAHLALGHVRMAGRWLTSDESYRAQGYEQFEGRWVRPEEVRSILAEREYEAGRRAEQAESESRVREAEARARAAEADARRAEADSQASEGGIPYSPFYGGGVVSPWVQDAWRGRMRGPRHEPPPVIVVPPPPIQRDHGATRNPDRRDPPPAAHAGTKH